jgi:hypothetical protein
MIKDETAVKLSAVSFTRFSQRIRPIYLLKFMVQRLAPSSPLTFSTKAKLPTATRRQSAPASRSGSPGQRDAAGDSVLIFPGSLCDGGSQAIKRLSQAARSARRRGNREQKVVELNSKAPVWINETKSNKV